MALAVSSGTSRSAARDQYPDVADAAMVPKTKNACMSLRDNVWNLLCRKNMKTTWEQRRHFDDPFQSGS